MVLLKDWVICVCITLIVAVLFSMFAPRGRMNSFYKMIISVFIFISFIYPLKSANFDKVKFENNFDFSIVEDSSSSIYSNMIENKIIETLKNHDVISTVSANVYVNNNEIEVKKVIVQISDDYDKSEVKNIIFDELGINAEVQRLGD